MSLWSLYLCAFLVCVELCYGNYDLYMNSTESKKIFGECCSTIASNVDEIVEICLPL